MTEAPDIVVADRGYVNPTETPSLTALSLGQAKWIGNVFAMSGFFKDARQEAQAITKVIAGQELGLKPMEAMTNIHVYDGKVSLGATLMARMIKQHPNYRYRLLRSDEEECLIEIEEHIDGEWVSLEPNLGFTIEEAQRSGLTSKANWKNYPGDMLFARAIGRAARRHCPDVFGGTIYTDVEMQDEGHETSSPGERRQEILDSQAADLAMLEKLPENDPVPPALVDPAGDEEPTEASPAAVGPSASDDATTTLFVEPQPGVVEPAPDAGPTPDTGASSDAVTPADREQVTAKVRELAQIIGAERTQKGYDKLRESIGMIEGETYSTHEQVEKILAGLDEAITAYSPKQEVPS